MEIDLEKDLADILATAEKDGTLESQAKTAPAPASDEKQDTEEEGVIEAADESDEEETTESKSEEGQSPSDEFEEELKNIDPEVREALSKVDAEVKKAQLNAFKKMRASFDKKQTEFGQEKKLAETAKQIFAKYGIDPNSGFSQIETLINFEKELVRDPKRAVNLLKQKFNVQDESPSGSEDKIDESLLTDEEKILFKQNKELSKKLEELSRRQEDELKRREMAEIEQANREIALFKNQQNEDGSLKHPYFDDLIEDMAKLAGLYPNIKIDKLYDKALRANDEIYAKSLEQVKRQEREKVLKEKKELVDKAKTINSQTTKSSPKTIAKRDLDEELNSILEANGY